MRTVWSAEGCDAPSAIDSPGVEPGTRRFILLVMALVLGADLSYLDHVDARVDVIDANALHGTDVSRRAERERLLASADAVIVGFPVPTRIGAAAPRLQWVHHTRPWEWWGLGGIGMEVARLGRGAGMRVVATRRSVTEPQHDVDFADLLLPADRLLEVAAQSDFLVVCSQLTFETRGFIDAAVFEAMPGHAVLVNVARGEQVDEGALVDALRSGSIGGAVLDVYDGDLVFQPPRHELVELSNGVVTPHLSGMGTSFAFEGRRLARENLRRFLAGEPLLNEVDSDRGY